MTTDYRMLEEQVAATITGESDVLAISANFVSVLASELPDTNWCGLYIVRNDELVLGPFVGKPACTRIALGRGVCGTAAARGETLRVDNVHEFSGHIACDTASESEIVIPLRASQRVFAVLDVDSPSKSRFTEVDQSGLESICRRYVARLSELRDNLIEFI